MFSDLDWGERSLRIDGVRFDLEQRHDFGDIDSFEVDRFRLYKTRALVDTYGQVLAKEPVAPIRHMFEIGLWDGGSAAFWALTLMPDVLVGIDVRRRGDSPYFTRVLSDLGLSDRVTTHWGVNQRDRAHLRALATGYAGGELDLVVDDASHIYWPTKSSFEALFPLVRPGGWYIVEDWAWEHMPEADARPGERSPEDLLHEIIAAARAGPAASARSSSIPACSRCGAGRRRFPATSPWRT